MNKELLESALKKVRVVGDIVIVVDIVLHGYCLYKEFIKPKLAKQKKVSADEVDGK